MDVATREITVGAMAMALYVMAYTLGIGTGDPLRFILWLILAFRYVAPSFFGVMMAHFFINISFYLLTFRFKMPLLIDSLVLIGDEPRGFYVRALGTQIYFVWVFYCFVYPVLIWYVFNRVGLYDRFNRAVGKSVN